jgi:flagellar biosynthetic protein FlhB
MSGALAMALEDRTEAATPKRREDARKRGMVARSPELGPAVVFLVGLLVLKMLGPKLMEAAAAVARACLGRANSALEPNSAQLLLSHSFIHTAKALAPMLAALAVVALLIGAAQTGLLLTFNTLSPDWSRINPLKGFTRLFSFHGLIDLVRSLLKVSIIGVICYLFARSTWSAVMSLSQYGLQIGLANAAQITSTLMLRVGIAIAVLAVLDYAAQRWQYERNLRMTKQEVREEMRQLEGDPVIRSYVRRRHREMGRRRMMDAVPKATAVVTNPVHVAVALRYERGQMPAPMVVAKGARLLAERIKEVAREHGVPIVEDPPLARALYKTVDVGEFIPPHLYRAVAEILAFVYRLSESARRYSPTEVLTNKQGGERG